jgi:methenyltetrahydrofolate cyclohydrolase
MTGTRLAEQRLTEILAAFRSPDPTPGGGSASALSGAVGTSLLAMVAGLPKPRAQSPDDQKRLAAARARSITISDQLVALMDRDRDAYDSVVAAFRMPKNSDEEQRIRSGRIQEALRLATEAPLAVMRACVDGMGTGADIAAFGNANAASDVQVALELLMAGLRGAKLNVAINLTGIRDPDYVEAAKRQAETLEANAITARDAASARLPRSNG